jgi:hypothetical protein
MYYVPCVVKLSNGPERYISDLNFAYVNRRTIRGYANLSSESEMIQKGSGHDMRLQQFVQVDDCFYFCTLGSSPPKGACQIPTSL